MFEIVDQQKVDPWGPCVCMCACVCVCVWVGGGGTTPIAPPPQLRAWTEAHHPLLGNSICIWKVKVSEDIFILLLHSHTFISYIWTTGWWISVKVKKKNLNFFKFFGTRTLTTAVLVQPSNQPSFYSPFATNGAIRNIFQAGKAVLFCKIKVIWVILTVKNMLAFARLSNSIVRLNDKRYRGQSLIKDRCFYFQQRFI